MDSIPEHLRITELTPSNEDVDSMRAAVTELSATWRKITDVGQILAKAASIAQCLSGDGSPSPALGGEVQDAVQKRASAFLHSESPLKVGICAGMAAVSLMSGELDTSGWTAVDVYSNALWSALAFQPPLDHGKRERLRRQVLELAQSRSMSAAEKARERAAVPDPLDLDVAVAADQTVTSDLKNAIGATVDALRRNAALDREELDFLWWAQLGRSRLLNRSLSAISEPTRLVAAGIEAANHLRRLPSEVHRDLVLRSVDADPELDMGGLLAAIGDDRTVLGEKFSGGLADAYPSVFPLLHILASGKLTGEGAGVARTASEWGARAILEAAIIRMVSTGIITL